jgi:hypothetical protein
MLRKHAGKARTELASQLQNCIFLTSTNHEPGFPSLSLWVPRGRGGAQISSVFASYLEPTNFRPSRRYLQRQPTLKHLLFVHQTPYAKTIGPPCAAASASKVRQARSQSKPHLSESCAITPYISCGPKSNTESFGSKSSTMQWICYLTGGTPARWSAVQRLLFSFIWPAMLSGTVLFAISSCILEQQGYMNIRF